jgi:hypothetical protein
MHMAISSPGISKTNKTPKTLPLEKIYMQFSMLNFNDKMVIAKGLKF